MAVSTRSYSLVLAGALLVAASASAQNLDSLRKSYTLPVPIIGQRHSPVRASPGTSVQSPTAFGADWGEGYIGAGYTERMRYIHGHNQMDGAVFAAFGFGNARKNVGLEVAATSFSTVRSGFGNHSSLSFKVHRQFPSNFALAAGWEDAIRTKGTDGGTSGYVVASSWYKRLTASAGVGGGRFKTEAAIAEDRKTLNVFGSLAYQVASPISVIADWSGQDLGIGASFVPLKRLPIYIEPGLVDLTGSAGDGARFVLGVGLGFTYRQLDAIFGTH
ncbi:MAG TPA: hypothetical protein VJS39_07105 [Gemmatimonadaceae bacterium]|nr:hypothetical protein [Gemmatimonadaceae bacterium]